MSCGACNQAQSGCQTNKNQMPSGAEDSNATSDPPCGDDCACNQENNSDCCGNSKSCGANKSPCPSSNDNQRSSQQNRANSNNTRKPSQPPRTSTNEDAKRNGNGCACGPVESPCPDRQGSPQLSMGSQPPQMPNSILSQPKPNSISQPYNRTNSVRKSAQPTSQQYGTSMPKGNGYMQQMVPNQQNMSQSPHMNSQQPKQIIAPCCFPDKSLLSLTDKNSQSFGGKQGPQCECNSDAKSDKQQPFVCASCAEFENIDQQVDFCDPVVEEENEPQCYQAGPEPYYETGQNGSELPDEKSKKKGGFWQELQFQIFQQQEGDEDDAENNGEDGCDCSPDACQNDDEVDKPKKSGKKIWQQLKLDIYQSKDDSSETENDSNSKQGWQQQLKLQIFQEKFSGGEDEQENYAPTEDCSTAGNEPCNTC